MTKQEILDALRSGYAEWLAALDAVPNERMSEPDAVGTWTLKDVVAHIASGHRWLAAQLDAAAHRQLPTATACFGQDEAPPPEINIANNQQRNEWNYERYRNWPLEAVQQEAEFAFGWLVRMIEELPEPAFEANYTIADYDNINHVRPATDVDSFRFPLWRLLYNGTAEHYPAHVRDVRGWLGKDGET
jgi:hypothetical protein